jgi:hypothetical protein
MNKKPEEVMNALQKCIVAAGSISEFSRRTGVRIETISRFLTRKTQTFGAETMDMLAPWLAPYLNNKEDDTQNPPQIIGSPARRLHDMVDLTSDEKILLDVFNSLPREVAQEKLYEIIALAQKDIEERRAKL